MHDFIDEELGKVAPYGVYDVTANEGWVSVGIDHDTAEFAVQSIRRWWLEMGRPLYPKARRLLITADCGGSNGYRVRLWRVQLQHWRTSSRLEVCAWDKLAPVNGCRRSSENFMRTTLKGTVASDAESGATWDARPGTTSMATLTISISAAARKARGPARGSPRPLPCA